MSRLSRVFGSLLLELRSNLKNALRSYKRYGRTDKRTEEVICRGRLNTSHKLLNFSKALFRCRSLFQKFERTGCWHHRLHSNLYLGQETRNVSETQIFATFCFICNQNARKKQVLRGAMFILDGKSRLQGSFCT